MIGRTNAGGGTGKSVAAISVTYPAGSTCTCSNGTKTLTAKDTSGVWLFTLPEAGIWVVSCTDGVNTATKNINLEYKTAVSVALAYRFDIVTSGSVASGLQVSGKYAQNVSYGGRSALRIGDGGVSSKQTVTISGINASPYNTLKVAVGRLGTWGGGYPAEVSLGGVTWKSPAEPPSNVTLSIDISNVSGANVTLSMSCYNTNDNPYSYVYDVWMEA